MPISEYEFVTKNASDERAFKSQYQMFLEVLLAKIRKYCAEQKIEVEKLFLDHDREHKGNGGLFEEFIKISYQDILTI